jgi:hypothetical protein
MSLLQSGGKLVMQGGSHLHNHGEQPTVFLRETKKHRKETRKVIAILASDEHGQRVKDHVGEVWTCKRIGDGNYRAIF